MGWEKRGEHRYYYRKVWRDGTCVSEYFGHGAAADMAARLDEIRVSRLPKATIPPDEPWAELFDDFEQFTDLMIRQAMVLADCHRHKRGEWRRRRVKS